MKATVDAQALRLALKRLKPHRAKYGLHEGNISVTAGGTSLIFQGTLDNSASVDAVVHDAGAGLIPLESTIKILGTYRKGLPVVLVSEPGCVWLDKLRLPTSAPI